MTKVWTGAGAHKHPIIDSCHQPDAVVEAAGLSTAPGAELAYEARTRQVDIQGSAFKHCQSASTTFLNYVESSADTYDHRSVRTGHPVRSAIHKH
jgi:hypothetical protein